MYILGISCYYHDSAAALVKNGVVIAAAEEERFTRIKHDSSFPRNAIAFCLKKANIQKDDLSAVVFYEKPLIKFERIFLNSLSHTPQSFSFFREGMKEWFFDKLWIKSHIVSELGISTKKLYFCEHHLSHASSSFFCSPYKKAAVLSIDGVGEWTTTSWGIGDDKKITLKEELRFPHSLGLLYSVFTEFAGFEANEGEYKLMGLAPYGKPRYIDKIHSLLEVLPDGSFSSNLSYFSYHYSLKNIYTKEFEKLFGKPNTKSEKVIGYYADIAASIQYVLEEILLRIVNYVYSQTKLEYLCYAGGVALNSVANWKIINNSPFKELYIHPAAGDSGGAVGAALWMYHTVLSKKRLGALSSAYLGDKETVEETKQFLEKNNIKYRKPKSETGLIDEMVEKLAKGKVIGFLKDEFEWGPRALGNRSILADPRSSKMKDVVNKKIKFREGFRPFAPSVLSEKATDLFSIQNKGKQYPFKFMLYVVPVKEEKKNMLGAVTHVDGTARPQFVEKKLNPFYHTLIQKFEELTGVPAVLNTSFNLKGEPIVNTSENAFNTFKKSGIDMLVLNGFIIEKK